MLGDADFANQKTDTDSPVTSPGHKSKHDKMAPWQTFATRMKKGWCAVCGNKKAKWPKDTQVKNYCAKCKVYLCLARMLQKVSQQVQILTCYTLTLAYLSFVL